MIPADTVIAPFRTLQGTAMKRVTQYDIYQLGIVRLLNWVRAGTKVAERIDEFFFTHNALLSFSRDAQSRVLLPNSTFEAGGIAHFLGTIIDQAQTKRTKGVGHPLLTSDGGLTPNAQENLSRGIAAFGTVLRHELEALPTYIIEKIGIYDTDALLTKADAALVVELTPYIPTRVSDDFKKAGTGLAFEMHTASGFHGYRAVDSMLRAYCQFFVGCLPTQRDWGTFIKALRDVPANSERVPNKRTIELLDRIRAEDRNPLIHPETDLSATEASIAFDLCRTAIVFMAMDIKNAS